MKWEFELYAFDEGKERGKAEGRELGRAEGRAEGAYQAALVTARKMLSKGFSTEDILEISGLSLQEITELKQENLSGV